MVILISREQLKFGKSRRQLTTGNIAHGKLQKRQNCVSIIIRQQKCNEKYDSVDIATTIVKRSFSKHLCLVEVNLKKSCIFPQSIFKKMPPGTPRNRIRDFSWATLLVVKGFPKHRPPEVFLTVVLFAAPGSLCAYWLSLPLQ